MRPRVPWMNEADDAILEFLQEQEKGSDPRVAFSPTGVYVNLVEIRRVLDRSPSTLSRRMSRLSKMGLLEVVDEDRGYYSITEKGLKYLSGDLDADDLSHPEDS